MFEARLQISLGKRYAGKTLRVERRGDGTVLLTAVAMIPEHQLWTMEEPDRSRIEQGLRWAATTAARETDLDNLTKKVGKPAGRARGRQR